MRHHRHTSRHATALVATLLIAAYSSQAPAQGPTIYRCGDSYSQSPCPGGRVVDTQPGPTARDQAEARQAIDRSERAARQMEQDRLAQEARASKAVIPPQPVASAPKPAASATRPLARRHARPAPHPDVYTAVVPREPKARKDTKPKKKD